MYTKKTSPHTGVYVLIAILTLFVVIVTINFVKGKDFVEKSIKEDNPQSESVVIWKIDDEETELQ